MSVATDKNKEHPGPDKRASRRVVTLLVIILGLCALFLAWQAFQYRGIVHRLAEWQYARFGDYYPSLTFLGLFTFLSIPGIALLLLWRRRREREMRAMQTVALRMVERTDRLQRYLGIAGTAAIAAAIASIIATFFLPGDDGPARHVQTAAVGFAKVNEGSTRLIGRIDTRMTARFDEKILFAGRRMFIAPMQSGVRAPVRFFVEIAPDFERPAVRLQASDGVLRHNALPGEIAQLYRNHGMVLARDNYMLYRTAYGPRWRFYALAIQCGIIGMMLSIASWFERRRVRRMTGWVSQISD